MGLYSKKLALFLPMFLINLLKPPKLSSNYNVRSATQFGFQKFESLSRRLDLEDQIFIFDVESELLKSPSLFPYFMLVAFEAGSLIRALVLFLIYPFIRLLNDGLALRVMVFVSFFGLKKDRFIEGRAVLPKFLLEDVGMESFEVIRKGKMTVAISDLPQVMIESFLQDYLNIDFVVGRDLKTFRGYFVGLMEEEGRKDEVARALVASPNAVGIGCLRKCLDCDWFAKCKEIFMVSEEARSKWHQLPRDLYPKPLIFHDGRLAFRPTFIDTLVMFMWLPLGLTLAIFRITVSLALPNWIRFPFLHLTGIHFRVFNSKNLNATNDTKKDKGVLYICNHRTLLDPLLLSCCLKRPLTAVVYSLSRISEMVSPIKTVRLTRNRDKDAALMQEMLSRGDLVVCPEGTTCREPYLLRFSPLFTQIADSVSVVAIDCDVSMFYGTTAWGFKCLDPVFSMMNPWPSCSVHFLGMVDVQGTEGNVGENPKYERANLVQKLIGKALGFTCTRLTRKDKYLILAGNEGIV